MWIGQTTHIEDEVGVDRYTRPVGERPEQQDEFHGAVHHQAFPDFGRQLRRGQRGGVDRQIREAGEFREPFALQVDRFAQGRGGVRQRMPAARLAEPLDQRRRPRVQVDDPTVDSRLGHAHVIEHAGQTFEVGTPVPGIDTDRQPLARVGIGDERAK